VIVFFTITVGYINDTIKGSKGLNSSIMKNEDEGLNDQPKGKIRLIQPDFNIL
jgi:hypothetical protein